MMFNRLFSHLRPLDFLFFLLSCAATAGSAWWVFGTGTTGGSPLVQIQSADGISLYPLDENRDISVPGPAGTTLLRIENGEIYAVESPGPRRIILQMGKIGEQGRWLASLPNRVFVRIISRSGDSSRGDVDAAVY